MWANDHPDWAVEGRHLLSDTGGQIKVLYIARIKDIEQADSNFVTAFAGRLASAIAYKVTTSRTMADQARKEASEDMASARSADGQEGKPALSLHSSMLAVREE